MIKINVNPFDKTTLTKGLKNEFPKYKIQTGLAGLQVRRSGFTITGNVKVKVKPQKGEITTQTNYDMVILFVIFLWPLGLYILLKKDKQKRMEKEVAEKIKEILQ